MHCPGSIALCRGIPDKSSPAADEGTFAHDIAAKALEAGLSAEHYLDETDGVFTVDYDMAQHIQTYLDVVRDLRLNQMLVEKQVSLRGLRDDITGTADCLGITGMPYEPGPTTLHVADLKFGSGVLVEADQNPQLMIYGLGGLLSCGQFAHADIVTMHIVQPRHRLGGHSHFSMRAEELRAWGKTVLRSCAEATEIDNALLAAGDWCQFCLGKPICPALRDASLARTREVFSNVETFETVTTPPDPRELTPDLLGRALKAFEMVEQWMSAVRKHAYNLAAGGVKIPGMKIVQKVGNRKWANEEEAEAILSLFDTSIYQKPKLLSPAQAEKQLPKDARKVIEQLTTRPVNDTVLAPEFDPRPGVNRADVFLPPD